MKYGQISSGLLFGFALGISAVYTLESYTWAKAMASFTCQLEGKIGVLELDENFDEYKLWCIDPENIYPAEEATERLFQRLKNNTN